MATRINFIELYSFYNDLDVSVIERLMEDYSISCSIKTLHTSRFPANPGEFQEKRMAVEEDKVENARKIINDAIRSGVISKEGKFRA
jgi:putative signal transducing protein